MPTLRAMCLELPLKIPWAMHLLPVLLQIVTVVAAFTSVAALAAAALNGTPCCDAKASAAAAVAHGNLFLGELLPRCSSSSAVLLRAKKS